MFFPKSRIKGATYDNYKRYSYKCGFCDENVSGYVHIVYMSDDSPPDISRPEKILIRYILCPTCAHASIWHKDTNEIIPSSNPGKKIEGLSPIVESVYEEARKCFSVGAYTANELLCRKLIMNIAVDKGAQENQSFKHYIEYLEQENFITSMIKNWADRIRDNGNEATHEIDTPNKKRAKSTFLFTIQLLTIIYEMPYLASLN